MFWKRARLTTGAELERAVSKTSDDWQADVQRLRSNLDALAIERVAVVTEAGRASLAGCP
jgi:hypothetical protein